MDVLDLERRAAGGMMGVLAGISGVEWSLATPCPEWTVEHLVAHLIAGNVKYTDIGHGADWSRGAPTVELEEDRTAQYQRTHATMLEAWRGTGALNRELTLPRGRGRSEDALFIHLGETLVHGWDLAVATAQRPAFDVDVVEASLANYASWLPAAGRPSDAPFADASPVAQGADPIDRLAAYLGRDVDAWATGRT